MQFLGLSIERANKKARVTELDGVRLTPAQQLAYMQAEHAADQMMEAIRWAKNLAWLILIIVMAVSYEDQEHYLEWNKFHGFAAILIPFVFDAATVLCVKVIGTYAMKRIAKIIALTVVLFPVSASAYINIQASPTAKVAIIYVLVVAMIPAIELIKAFINADFTKMRGVETTLLSSVTADFISDEEKAAREAARKARGLLISEGRARKAAERAAEAAAAAEAEEKRREAYQLRGMLAAETRQLKAQAAAEKAAEEAARVIRSSRSRKPVHPVDEINALEPASQ